MRIILDTNVFLVCISSKSKFHWLFQSLLKGDFSLCVTTDILAEYAEIIEQQMGHSASENALAVLENLPNVIFITTYYRFGLLQDEDDNKFVDCAIASNADFIVTHDKDFNLLKTINFPVVTIANTDEFKHFLNQKKLSAL